MTAKIVFCVPLLSLWLLGLSTTGDAHVCEPLKIHHVVDMSTATTEFLDSRAKYPGILALHERLHGWLNWKTSFALSVFSDKPSQTGNSADKCYDNKCSHVFGDESHIHNECYATFWDDDLTTTGDGGNSNGGSQFDAVINAVRRDWDAVFNETGKKVVFLDTPSLPASTSATPLPPFPLSGTDNCNEYNYATPNMVKQAFQDENALLMILTSPANVPIYKSLLKEMGGRLVVGNFAISLRPFWDVFFKRACASCSPSDGALQLMHLQDVSSSYHRSPNFGYMKTKLDGILNGLKGSFGSSEFGLGAFSDKPIPYSGYPDDYCYQEKLPFTSDVNNVIDAYNALKRRSGRDFRESQLDALRRSMNSTSLSWNRMPKLPDGRRVLRVVMIATDSSPHEKGVFNHLPAHSDSGCSTEQYPTFAEIKDMLDDMGFFAVIVSTRNLAPFWTYKVRKWNAKVVTLADDTMTVVKAIENAFAEMCLLAN